MTKGQVTRQKIVEQAAPLFNRLGYAGCSMQDIMAATGLEKGGLYRHFSSKEELAKEAFRYSLAWVTDARWKGIEEVEGSVEKLRFLVRRFVDIRSIFPGDPGHWTSTQSIFLAVPAPNITRVSE